MNTKIHEFGSLILLQLSFNLVQLHSASSDLNYGSSSVGLLPAVSFYGVASAVRGSENFGEMGAVSLDGIGLNNQGRKRMRWSNRDDD